MSDAIRFEVVPLHLVPAPELLNPAGTVPLVLIVDDEALIADTLAVILHQEGFHTLRAYGGSAGLELARLVPPDLLISDVSMPEMDGLQLAAAVIHDVPSCKVLLISGHAGAVQGAQAWDTVANFTLLQKPVHPSEMLRQIGRLLGKLDLRRPPRSVLAPVIETIRADA